MYGIVFNLAALIITITSSKASDLSSNEQPDLLAPRTYCGYQHVDEYHRDNDNISIHEFPWMAQLLYKEEKIVECSGSLINNRYILTAAHCLQINNPLVAVRLGDFNVTADTDCVVHSQFGRECIDPIEEFGIEEVIPHPDYTYPALTSDIGLVRLSRDVLYSDYIRPICLPTRRYLKFGEDVEISTSGWGFTGLEEQQTDIKKKILATFTSQKDCKEMYKRYHMFVFSYHLCTLNIGKQPCKGDSGAPLMRRVNNQWEQIGVLSFGRCLAETPTVYVNVSHYLDWIREIMRI